MRKLRIYLDNCCFNRPYDDQTQLKIELETKAKLFIQNLAFYGKVDLVWSYMLDFENDKNPFPQKRRAIAQWRKLAATDVEETPQILEIAEEAVGQGLALADALHVACAINAGCDCFITVDRRLLKYKTSGQITLCNPMTFLESWEDEENDN